MGIFNLLIKQKKEELIEVDKDLRAIVEFLKGVDDNVQGLAGLFRKFIELRKQFIHHRAVKNEFGVRKSIMEQVKLYDKIVESFETLELDTDIAGERVKKIAKALKTDAEKHQINQKWLDLVKKDEKWTFDW